MARRAKIRMHDKEACQDQLSIASCESRKMLTMVDLGAKRGKIPDS